MKSVSRFVLFILIIMVSGLVLPVAAQEEVSEDSKGVITVTLNEGSTFAVDEEGVITLNIVSNFGYAPSTWFIEGEFGVYNYPLIELQGDWDFAEELTASAVLTLTESFHNVELSAPTFDMETGVLSYVVTFEEEIEADKDGNLLLPAIDMGTLFIEMDANFVMALGVGRDLRLESTRGLTTCSSCNSTKVP